MSEVTFISAQFGELSEAVEHINRAIIALKKEFMIAQKRGEKVQLAPDELDNARASLESFLELVMQLEKPDEHSPQLLPNNAVEELRKNVIENTPGFFEKIRGMLTSIKGAQLLDKDHFDLLDQLVETLDQERTELFKKLRAARG